MQSSNPVFQQYRPALERLAYRMLGSLADVDDVMQEAYLRWSKADRCTVESPRAYLITVVTRLCIDQRRALDARKEVYIGPWLPEPLVESTDSDPSNRLETAETVSIAFLVLLESLAPVERAAYLLRRVFDQEYEEIAHILEKSEPACRQLVSRAEQRVHARRPRFAPNPGEVERLTGAFLSACSTGDMSGMMQLLASDVVMVSDGGGKAIAARAPVLGADRVARFFLGLTRKSRNGFEVRRVLVNGQPGILTLQNGEIHNVTTLDIIDGQIAACFIWRNPEKLSRIDA